MMQSRAMLIRQLMHWPALHRCMGPRSFELNWEAKTSLRFAAWRDRQRAGRRRGVAAAPASPPCSNRSVTL